MWLFWVIVVVGACIADQPLPSSPKTTTSPLHTVNVKVAEAGDDFCASSLPLLQVILGLPLNSGPQWSHIPIFDSPVTLQSL